MIGSLVLNFSSVFACSELQISYDNQYFVGRNFDWLSKYAAIVVNSRGTLNNTKDLLKRGKSFTWVAKYGSVTINLAEKNGLVHMPAVMTGMNEYGLSASTLWLAQAEFPRVTSKPVVPTALWAKYFLDNAKTVADAVKLAGRIDIEPNKFGERGDIKLHLMIHDVKGNVAVMEYLHGKLAIHQGKDIPIPVLTNDPYIDDLTAYYNQQSASAKCRALTDELVANVKKESKADDLAVCSQQSKGINCRSALTDELVAAMRFIKLAYYLQTMPKLESREQAIAHTFNALNYVMSPTNNDADTQTVWSFVFDLSDKTLYLKSIDNQQIRIVQLTKFNLANQQPVKFLSVNNNLSGYVEKQFNMLKP